MRASTTTTWRQTFLVAVDVRQEDGRRICNYPVSRSLVSRGTCRRVYKRLKRQWPGCFMVSVQTRVEVQHG